MEKESEKYVSNLVSNTINTVSKNFNKQGITALTIFLVLLSICAIVFVNLYINWILYKKDEYGCKKISELVPTTLSPINTSDVYSYPVNFYYIKTAYNCCSEGSYVNDYVNLCILEKIITQGVRCFDFEIFNIDDIPVISTSINNNYWIKETFNYVIFSLAFEKIINQAFNSLYCSNYSDPVFISLRMNTNNINVYNNLAKIFKEYINQYLLEDKYNYGNTENFCATVPLNTLMKKIVIMVNSPNTLLQDSDLDEFVNINTGPKTPNFQYLPFSVIKANYKDETILYTKERAIFVSPDLNDGTPINPDSSVCLKLGVQFIGMSYQYNDSNLQAYQSYFDKYKHAFIMKNEVLLPKKYNLTITVPGEESNPNKCNEIKIGDTVVSTFGTGCK